MPKKKIQNIFYFICLAAFTVCARFAMAAEPFGLDIGSQLPLGSADPFTIAMNIIRLALSFLALIALVLLLYAGFLWMTAGGNAEKVEKAKKTLKNGLIGLVLIVCSWGIVTFIINKLGEATGASCTVGASRDCQGCLGTGTQVCTGSGTWSSCDTDCGEGLTCCGKYCSTDCSLPKEFTITKIFPKGKRTIPLNGTAIIQFNQPFDQDFGSASYSTINNIKAAAGTATSLKETKTISSMRLNGNKSCQNVKADSGLSSLVIPPGHEDDPCFDPDKIESGDDLDIGYRVEAQNDGFRSKYGSLMLVGCSGLGKPCESNFSVSPSLDTKGPSIRYQNHTICTGADNYLSASVTDDWGVMSVDFYLNNLPIGSASFDVAKSVNARVDFSKDKIIPGIDNPVKVVARDIANNETVYEGVFKPWPDHCCNGVKDEGKETGVDCGNLCPACPGQACAKDKDLNSCSGGNCDDNKCSTAFCGCNNSDPDACKDAGYSGSPAECCICEEKPYIDWVSPRGGFCDGQPDEPCLSGADCSSFVPATCNTAVSNGAAGNMVSIGGRYFGSYDAAKSKVYFDDKEAQLAGKLNVKCKEVWTDNQIIAIMPAGTGDNPVIKVANKNGNEDTTDNDRGNIIIFQKNAISRPGLCDLDPNEGWLGQNIDYSGIKLASNKAYFGNLASYVPALDSSFTTDLSGSAKVPDLKGGNTSTYTVKDKRASNYLAFTVKSDDDNTPYISSFSPLKGNAGQYVTIFGRGFGSASTAKLGDTHNVYFDSDLALKTDGTKASFEFPEVCANSVWTNNQIIVKVPKGLDNVANYYLVVNVNGAEGFPVDSSSIIPSDDIKPFFDYDSGEPLKPSLCKIDPTMGPVDIPVSLWGEYFGETKGKIIFNRGIERADADISVWDIAPEVNSAKTTVPAKAITGPVYIRSGEGDGNGLNFKVGTCVKNTDCGSGGEGQPVCCQPGSLLPGQCKDKEDDCYSIFKTSVFEMIVSTNVTYCDGSKEGGCQADQTMCGDARVCDPDACICREPCKKNGGVCDAKNTVCTDPKQRCEEESCFCKTICLTDPGDGSCLNTDCLESEPNCVISDGASEVGADCGFCSKDTPGESCASLSVSQCPTDDNCPNSPGRCDTGKYQPEQPSCNCSADLGPGYAYDDAANRCKKQGTTCSIKETENITHNGKTYPFGGKAAQCRYVKLKNGTVYRWQYNPQGRSCADNWVLDANNWCSFTGDDESDFIECALCPYDFKGANTCISDGINKGDNKGICVQNRAVCPQGSACDAEKCSVGMQDICECCCREDHGSQDCCYPLKCEGDCGTEANYGLCTGCSGVGSTQAEHDEACNCFGSSGKYCDTSAAGGKGACRDCAQLTNAITCSDHSATCCVDGAGQGRCRGGEGDTGAVHDEDGQSDSVAYCRYFRCGDEAVDGTGLCLADDPVASSTGAGYKIYKSSTCDSQCGPGGEDSCFDKAKNTCSVLCQSAYDCLGEDGCNDSQAVNGCSAGDESCLCCCDPSKEGSDPSDPDKYDKCKSLNQKLSCYGDKGDCTGSERGLCCGCTNDDDCADRPGTGCGSDTCCHGRPKVESTAPSDEAVNICRNSMISAVFDQPMDISSFSDSVIVAGEYGANQQCPAGTRLLVVGEENIALDIEGKNFFQKIFYSIKYAFKYIARHLANFVKAYTAPDSSHNYCAVPGTIGGFNEPYGNTSIGRMTFSPTTVFDGGRKYYAIIKGDANLDNTQGAKSIYKVGMNGPHDEIFNALNIQKGYIWMFTTMPETSAHNGICCLDKVKIDPYSYLFTTNANDTADDSPKDSDTKADSDKVFRAKALSSDGQQISSIADVYRWDWSWSVDNEGIVKLDISTMNQDWQLAKVQSVKEGQTYINATAKITEDNTQAGACAGATKGDSRTSNAAVFVMLCSNPWPPINADWTWAPWKDEGDNCSQPQGGCHDTNFQYYYCRDAGGAGSADDLPAIATENPNAQIFGSSTIQNVLKEFLFFREKTPAMTSGNTLNSIEAVSKEGGKAGLWWDYDNASLDKYIIQFGTRPGQYRYSRVISKTESHSEAAPYMVTGLENGTKYYFALSVRLTSGAESALSNEVAVTPEDRTAPNVPGGVAGSYDKDKNEVTLKWAKNSDDTTSYKIYYGTETNNYGGSKNVGDVNIAIISLTIDSPDTTYYFALTALDKYGNESGKSMEFSIKYDPEQAERDEEVFAEMSLRSGPAGECSVKSCVTVKAGETCKVQIANQRDIRSGSYIGSLCRECFWFDATGLWDTCMKIPLSDPNDQSWPDLLNYGWTGVENSPIISDASINDSISKGWFWCQPGYSKPYHPGTDNAEEVAVTEPLDTVKHDVCYGAKNGTKYIWCTKAGCKKEGF